MALSTDILSDLTTMFADWGDTAVWNATTITGMFYREYFEAEAEGAGVSTDKSAFIAKTTDVSSAAQGQSVSITSALNALSGTAYTIASVQHAPSDIGPGATRLVLRRA